MKDKLYPCITTNTIDSFHSCESIRLPNSGMGQWEPRKVPLWGREWRKRCQDGGWTTHATPWDDGGCGGQGKERCAIWIDFGILGTLLVQFRTIHNMHLLLHLLVYENILCQFHSIHFGTLKIIPIHSTVLLVNFCQFTQIVISFQIYW